MFVLDNVCGIWPVAVSRGKIPGQTVGYGFLQLARSVSAGQVASVRGWLESFFSQSLFSVLRLG